MRKKQKVTLSYLHLSYLVSELADLLKKEIKIVSRYHLHTLNRIVSEQIEELQAMRNSLIEKHGTKRDDGKGFEIKEGSEGRLLFDAEMNDLLAIEVELELPEIYLSDLEGVSGDKNYGILFNLIKA